MRRLVPMAVAAVVPVLSLVGCDSSGSASGRGTPTPTVTQPATATIEFCVGDSSTLGTRGSDVVLVRFTLSDGRVLTPSAPVGTRVSVEAPAGPFTVTVKGHKVLSGMATAGRTESGSIGTGCPA